jgi:hypothetical protein
VVRSSAAEPLADRWSQVRNVITSRDLMDQIARLAGWKPVRWFRGDRSKIRLPDNAGRDMLGQSICVLKPG